MTPGLELLPPTRGRPRTHCPYCALQCAMTVDRGVDGAVSVTGDETFPVNRGQLCIKGHSAGALLTSSERLTAPRVRGRDGALVPVSWDAALDLVSDRLRELIGRHGPSSVAVFGSGALTNEKAYALGKFARVILRTPHIDYNGRYCMAAAASALNTSLGLDRGLPFPVSDIARAECILAWGSNWADTMPPLAQWFAAQREAGGRLIVVDPRVTATARDADLYLQPAPGSDLALANGMLFVAIEEALIDEAYIQERTTGFDQVRAAVLGYWPARVEQLTGVSEARIRRATRLLARASTAMLLSGRGPEQQSKGSDTVLAFLNLMLALGKVGRPGSGYGTLTGQGNGQGGREHGQKADQLPGYRHIDDPVHRAAVANAWGVDPGDLPGRGHSAYELLDALGPKRADGGGGIRGLLVMGSNVAVASPAAGRVGERLDALDLLVVCDAFLNETSARAHVVLPVPQWAEETGTMTNLEGRVILRRPSLSAPPDVRSDLWILCELARRVGRRDLFPSADPEVVFAELARVTAGSRADYSGLSYAKLERHDGVFWPCPGDDHPGTPRMFLDRFAHPDGRARFVPVEHRDAGEMPDAEYPLYFTTGRYREHYNSGAQTRRVRELTARQPGPRLQAHPALLRRLHLEPGDTVRVESRRGSVDFEVAASAEIRSDTVFAPFHWGGRQAANLLTNPALDPRSRMPEFKVCAVRLVPEKSRP